MKNNLKIQILIETEIQTGFICTFEISDYLTNYSNNVLSSEQIINNFKTAMKKLNKKFSTITVSLLKKNDYTYSYDNTLFSCRYVHNYGEIKRSNFDGMKYYDFLPSEFKNIQTDIKNTIETANREFIEQLKTV